MKRKAGKILLKLGKSLVVGIIVILLSTIGINAVDNFDNMSESIVGKLFFGESKSACPEEMVFVQASWGDFCIDKYEVSASDGCDYLKPTNSSDSKYNVDNPKCNAISVPGALPWTNISLNQAVSACLKEGKRLPSNREWSYAAQGTPDPNAGWGNDDCQVSNNWDSQPGFTGSGARCESFVGAFDMIGNVWEWVEGSVVNGEIEDRMLPNDGYVAGINENDAFPSATDKIEEELYNNDYFWIKNTDTRTISRGGYWNNQSGAGQYSHYIVSNPSDTGNANGFRCVQNANLNN